MSRRRILGISLTGVLVAVGVALLSGLAASPAAAQQQGLSIGSASAPSGSSASVNVRALNFADPGLGAWSIDVSYDPSFVSVADCDALEGGVCNPEFGAGVLRFTGASARGLEGNTTLAMLTFRCVADGTSPLNLTVQVLADATVGGPQRVTVTPQNGTFTCGGTTPGGDDPVACAPFEFQEDAQAALQSDPSDPAGLDANGNGIACDFLPRRSTDGGNGEEAACARYLYQEFAQAVLNADPTRTDIDPDRDGLACENLPQLPTVPGGVYNGSIAGGGAIQITLDSTGRAISSISISGLASPCATISQGSSVSPPVPLTLGDGPSVVFGHSFFTGPNQAPMRVDILGQLLPNGTMEGVVTVVDLDASDDNIRNCNQDPRFFVTNVAGAPAPPAPPPSGGGTGGVLGVSQGPSAGTGPGAISPNSPMVWLVAGLIGAGVAWLSTGLAGAGLAFAGGWRTRSRAAPRPPAPRPPAPRAETPPAGPFDAQATGPFNTQASGPFSTPAGGPFARPARGPSMPRLDSRGGNRAIGWLASAREELRRSGINGAPGFDQRRRR